MASLNKLREAAFEHTIQAVKESVGDDNLTIQTIRSMDDMNKTINILAKRLRDWYSLYNPEFENACPDHEAFCNTILTKSKKVLLKELKVSSSMGPELKKPDIEAMHTLAQQIQQLFALRQSQESYLESVMDRCCPNVKAVAGTTVGARLLSFAGSLKRLAQLPASTVQLLGAEKALFRHLVTGARAPKHGIIIMHPLVAKAKAKGRAARVVADKISIAARIDYFKGEFIGDKLKEQMEAKL
ncbi:MAG: NOP5/NOP56 family protein [Candidatus Nanoarchaeia archaeon]